MKETKMTEYEVIDMINNFMEDCDRDSLIALFESIYGGTMTVNIKTEEYIWKKDDEN